MFTFSSRSISLEHYGFNRYGNVFSMDARVVAFTHAREHRSEELRGRCIDGCNKLMLFCHMKPELGEFVRKGVKLTDIVLCSFLSLQCFR